MGPFYYHGFTVILAWISDYIQNKVWGEITYPFPNFNVEVWEWISNFIPHFTVYVITYPGISGSHTLEMYLKTYLFYSCQWNNTECPSESIKETYTDFGKCYSFNWMPDAPYVSEKAGKLPVHQSIQGFQLIHEGFHCGRNKALL